MLSRLKRTLCPLSANTVILFSLTGIFILNFSTLLHRGRNALEKTEFVSNGGVAAPSAEIQNQNPEQLKIKNILEAHQWKLEQTRKRMKSRDPKGTFFEQDDPFLIEAVQRDHIKRPSPGQTFSEGGKKDILNPNTHYKGQMGQSKLIDDYFGGKRNGFFIEAGAWNGVYLSNSLFLELERNWTGLLVEANTAAFESLLKYHRPNAFAAHNCLSLTDQPYTAEFDGADVFGAVAKSEGEMNSHEKSLLNARNNLPEGFRNKYEVQCLPLFTLLKALGNPVVDYFSLDVEGAELDILRTIPWDKVDIRTFTIEVEHSDKNAIIELMKNNGYELYKEVKAVDLMFVKKK